MLFCLSASGAPTGASARPAPDASEAAREESAFRASALEKSKIKEIYDVWALNPINGLTRTGMYFLDTQAKLLRLTGAFAPFAGPVGVAWVFVNELADARPAYGSLGDPYRSATGLFDFARLPVEQQAKILRLDDAFARWYAEQQAALDRGLPGLSAIKCGKNEAAITALAGERVKLEIERDDRGVYELVRAVDPVTRLRAEYELADGMLVRVKAWYAERAGGEEMSKELTLPQYENFLGRGTWAYGREAHRHLRRALVVALFRADLVARQCPSEAAAPGGPHEVAN